MMVGNMRIYSFGLIVAVALALFVKVEAGPSYARPAGQLYRRYCISCHGTDGKSKTSKGKYNHARDLTDADWQADVSDERIFNSIMNGRDVRGNMPPFGQKLKDDEINSLVTFVRALKG
jgi:mono/diheme cytochrome c family protein